MYYNFVGTDFLGKLHNTKQHIQFIKYIKGELDIPIEILRNFLTSYNHANKIPNCIYEDTILNTAKMNRIKSQFNDCDWYIFEICSIKLYKNKGFEVQHEHTNDYTMFIQSKEDLKDDLYTIRSLIPYNKKILFQVHFRPNIIYNDENKKIVKREVIYEVVNEFCDNNYNTFIYDPSILLRKNTSLYDGDTHFTPIGSVESFNYIHEYFLQSDKYKLS
jgi:hypothetical protein